MKTEVNAIQTGGLWYGYVMVNGKIVYQEKIGLADRDAAITEARAWLAVQNQAKVFNQENGLD